MEIWLGRIKIPDKMTFLVLVLDLKTLASYSNRLPLDPELWSQEICSRAVFPVSSWVSSHLYSVWDILPQFWNLNLCMGSSWPVPACNMTCSSILIFRILLGTWVSPEFSNMLSCGRFLSTTDTLRPYSHPWLGLSQIGPRLVSSPGCGLLEHDPSCPQPHKILT